MSQKNLVTQGEIGNLLSSFGALADNLNQHVNDPLSAAHGWTLRFGSYLDAGGNYHSDFGSIGAQAIPGIYNTGVNNDGSLGTVGNAELHWQLIQVPYSPNTGGFIQNSGYAAQSAHAKWISNNIEMVNTTVGTYKWRLTFNLTGLNPSTAFISGRFASDNQCTGVLINGVSTGITGPNGTFNNPSGPSVTFQISTGFVPGVNTLDFLVYNDGGPTALLVEISGVAYIGGPQTINTLFNTGVDSSSALLPALSADPHWTCIQSADPSFPGPACLVVNDVGGVYPFNGGTWASNGPRSKWISVKGDFSSNHNLAGGTYVYRLTFSLAGLNPSTAIVRGLFSCDNTCTQVLLNGQVTGVTAPDGTWVVQPNNAFVFTSGFVSGNNTLDFYIVNGDAGGTGPSGLRVEITGTAQTAGTGQLGRILRFTIGSNEFFAPVQGSGGIDGTPDPAIPVVTGATSTQTADPASDLSIGSPTECSLVTTFAALIEAISSSSNSQLFAHAGAAAEGVHGGASWQVDNTYSSAGYLVGRRSINIVIGGVAYKIVCDISPAGPR